MKDLVSEFLIEDGIGIKSMSYSVNSKLLFCGTSSGTVRIYPFPFTEELM